AVDGVRIGFLVVGREVDVLRIGRHSLVEGLDLVQVLDGHERAPGRGQQVEARILFALAIALHDDPSAVRRDAHGRGAVLPTTELSRKGARPVEPPYLPDASDGPAEVHHLAVSAEPADAGSPHVDERLDPPANLGRDGAWPVFLEQLRRDAIDAV